MADVKSILDPRFKYVPSHKTNIEKTFARIREEQKKAEKNQALQTVRTLDNFRHKVK